MEEARQAKAKADEAKRAEEERQQMSSSPKGVKSTKSPSNMENNIAEFSSSDEIEYDF